MKQTDVIRKLHDALSKHHIAGLKSGQAYQRGDLCDESLMALVAARSLPEAVNWQQPVGSKVRNLNPARRVKNG